MIPMDNVRVLIAVVLSVLVFLVWNWIFPPPRPVPSAPTQAVVEQQAKPSSAGTTSTDPVPSVTTSSGERIKVETPEYSALFNSRGGVLERFELKNYRATMKADSPLVSLISEKALTKAPLGIIWDTTATWREGEWGFEGQNLDLTKNGKGKLVFVGKVGSLKFVRTFTFEAGTYAFTEELRCVNEGTAPAKGDLAFSLSSSSLSSEKDSYNKSRIAFFSKGNYEEEDDVDDLKEKGLSSPEPVQWAGIAGNYFLLAVAPKSDSMLLKAKFEDETFRVAVSEPAHIDPGQERIWLSTYYLGPKDKNYLAKTEGSLSEAINYGWFSIIAKPLILVLHFFNKYVGNYGVAIILLTVAIKIIFWPLSQKSYRSMEQLKKIQPLMAKIREKHKDDRQQMNQEMMSLYKTYKVNPMGGCLPMIVQIPVFFGLYQALMGAIELRHAPFIAHVPFTDIIWLADLSAKDPFYVTPIIMGATMFLQQKMTPSPGDPMQAKIMLFMPIIFTFVFLSFPSGLVIYWLVNNVLSIAQQWLMMRKA